MAAPKLLHVGSGLRESRTQTTTAARKHAKRSTYRCLWGVGGVKIGTIKGVYMGIMEGLFSHSPLSTSKSRFVYLDLWANQLPASQMVEDSIIAISS